MPKHTSVTLGDHFQTFVDTRVRKGRFGSASEVVRAALRLMEQEEAEEEAKLDGLRAAIQEGIDSGPAESFSLEGLNKQLDRERR